MSRRATGRGGDVPLFLQKTYQMIETCPDDVASWSADGRTFVVKDVPRFESSVIPQYFKHSKFSSFVRQLNFYGFRKVKYSDSLRINADEDRATANYWRFRHDLFIRGRRDLLGEIRRNVGQGAPVLVRRVPAVPGAPGAVPPAGMPTAGMAGPPGEVRELKSEMSQMRYRLDSMAKDIDELTGMVKKVTVADNAEEGGAGSKRKKTAAGPNAVPDAVMPDAAPSSLVVSPGGAVPDEAASATVLPDWDAGADIDMLLSGSDQILPDVAPSSDAGSLCTGGGSFSRSSSGVSDEGFVDELYDAFASEGPLDCQLAEPAAVPAAVKAEPTAEPAEGGSRPDPVIMRRIEDSLSTLPRDMHELVATRLISAIEGAAPPVLDAPAPAATGAPPGKAGKLDRSISVDADDAAPETKATVPAKIPLPLAVAALKAVLSEYGMKVECVPGDAAAEQNAAGRGSRPSSPPGPRPSRSPSPSGAVRGYKSKDPLLAKRMGRGLPVVPLHA
mmetsp:Transcript_28310/g.67448  ORF Transcript_28310/g.67448 Transcript_28310/m.67448 type:complete len:502 (+) Transcript_28310:317-1822(+)